MMDVAVVTLEFVYSCETVVSAVFASEYRARKLLRVDAVFIAGVA